MALPIFNATQKIIFTYQFRFKKRCEIKHFVARQMQNFLSQGGVQNFKIHIHINLDLKRAWN